MKVALRTIFFHFVCILIFSALYTNETYIDRLSQSVTIQAGVGVIKEGDKLVDERTKLLMIAQQLLLISTHVVTLYIFTL